MEQSKEVVLLTGSNGFLGRHVLKHLLQDDGILEIRALDKTNVSGTNNVNNNQTIYKDVNNKIKYCRCDLVNLEACRKDFRGVDVVLHCAGYVDYEYPPNVDELQKNNVDATKNVIKLCIEENVGRLVHCSSTEVTLQTSWRGGIVAVSIYKPEPKLAIPVHKSQLIFGEYAASKLKAEGIVLKAHGTPLKNGSAELQTVALRPTLLYGEGDPHLLTKILRLSKERDNYLPRLSSSGSKQQITYVGNAAWAFIRAKNTLLEKPEAIAGLPVTVTDDTLIEDLTSFCQRVTKPDNPESCIKLYGWTIPLIFSYFAAFIIELLCDLGFIKKLKVPPRSMVAYLGSMVLYSRARASIHMNYWPKYSFDQTCVIASKYYSQLFNKKQCEIDDTLISFKKK